MTMMGGNSKDGNASVAVLFSRTSPRKVGFPFRLVGPCPRALLDPSLRCKAIPSSQISCRIRMSTTPNGMIPAFLNFDRRESICGCLSRGDYAGLVFPRIHLQLHLYFIMAIMRVIMPMRLARRRSTNTSPSAPLPLPLPLPRALLRASPKLHWATSSTCFRKSSKTYTRPVRKPLRGRRSGILR